MSLRGKCARRAGVNGLHWRGCRSRPRGLYNAPERLQARTSSPFSRRVPKVAGDEFSYHGLPRRPGRASSLLGGQSAGEPSASQIHHRTHVNFLPHPIKNHITNWPSLLPPRQEARAARLDTARAPHRRDATGTADPPPHAASGTSSAISRPPRPRSARALRVAVDPSSWKQMSSGLLFRRPGARGTSPASWTWADAEGASFNVRSAALRHRPAASARHTSSRSTRPSLDSRRLLFSRRSHRASSASN